MKHNKGIGRRLAAGVAAALLAAAAHADTSLLNVSYDVTRELYKDINASFVAAYKQKTGETVSVRQSHGASSAQALSVLQGLQADVVTMNQPNDIDLLAERGQLLPKDWRARLPDNSSPYSTTMVFLVRHGNPKQIRDWSDLAKPGVQVIIANPKTSGNGRYAYLAAWGYQKLKGATDQQALDFEKAIFRNVPVLDSGGRGATTTFTQRGIGDVLVTFENEVALIDTGAAGASFDAVYPSASILAEPPVAIVDKVVDKKGTRRAAQAYLDYLYSPAAQEIVAQHHLRPRDPNVLKKHASEFKPLRTFSVEQIFGSWANAQKTHFADGGTFDKIIVDRK
ncbi:sulfate ABC transporter, sulfate-binding family protein [Burkholderia thailandensis MSMB121]|uniref:Sulfate ABC transporter substrate-binding protein n=2 Tax=Burkholderia humptydooensis TaxID=430531 RepID=A0A7U4STC5_9BURK|nr:MULTISPECIES: sulfate ABC transporter substrate-binding protein [Burkholderia]AGK49174.1 sulfate ABC transporter, sulfate-binding family protein [Burkholderia thailandensis MSMB121]ATF35052.1 sulfate ABC transporter substrate-binding protein [Burkholderia thailandensis]AJY41263.1 sulfate ABC transporter, sulfate-binding family protein [Burkholderia sp. 2002721687]ALX43930.1 thiosulfate transporter subunit [Burkholderia humptydooensis]KST75625.1 thiosulfate transporter subunit [Burkholderia 